MGSSLTATPLAYLDKMDKIKNSKEDKQLLLASQKAMNTSKYYNLNQLKKLLHSSNTFNRLFALQVIRNQINNSKPIQSYFTLSKNMIEDSNNNCRWQSLIITGEFLDKYPDDIFKIIVKYGSSKDEDMRTAISSILLEHLLEKDFKKYFNLFKEYSKNNSFLLDTLSKCWVNQSNSREQKEINNYLKNFNKYKNVS
jgi:hypothetical protein